MIGKGLDPMNAWDWVNSAAVGAWAIGLALAAVLFATHPLGERLPPTRIGDTR